MAGEYALLAVKDDGSGMDKETQLHLFEPFFTTKGTGKGTGLGLATVYGIVKQNNGFINVYSELEHGASFTIYLPRHEGGPGEARRQKTGELVIRGRETILLVEDEPASLNLIGRMLENQGYTILRAGSPREAIRLAREYVGEIHLLLTDVIMPEMNGQDLAKSLRPHLPRLKLLFTSGYTADVIAHQGVLDEGVHFIQKPFSRKELAAKVREALEAIGSR